MILNILANYALYSIRYSNILVNYYMTYDIKYTV